MITPPTMLSSTLPPSKPCCLSRAGLTRLILLAAVLTGDITRAADTPAMPIVPLPRVQPGVVIPTPNAQRWNRVIYLAVSRITQGDASSVPAMVRARVPLFTLAMLATVVNTREPTEPPLYRLAEVAAGYAVPLSGHLTVISTESPPAAAGLDYLGRQVLSANGRNLGEVRRVAATDTMQVVDVDSLYLVGGRHAPLVMRHFIWADPRTGRCACCVWLLQKQAGGGLMPTGHPPRWLQEGTRDERAVHVDANKFFLGMPTKESFALTSLPPGVEVAWAPEFRQAAAHSAYGPRELQQLALAVDAALKPLRTSAN